jgi:dTDP-4-amino-4,6-dideoxygalactose transaminase
LACDMSEILRIARKHNLKVIEDAAHALPTRYQGKLIGDLESDATVFSFYATKTITTGEGGMVVTRNLEIAARCRMMRLHGISRDAFDRYTSTKPAWHYEVVAPGFKYNLTDLASSMGIHQLKKAWSFQQRRQAMAERYDIELAGLPITCPPHAKEGDLHAWHLYVIQLRATAEITRDQFIGEMSNRGISCSVHFIPLHLHPYWRDTYQLKPDDFPTALSVYQSAVSLPLYTKMSDEDQTRVITAIKDILS